ncbi:MAG: S-layer homology domain-containing protein [Clostridia bacterium]|nr:S-layer homology domain-containing protein [Clostridia bacterium]
MKKIIALILAVFIASGCVLPLSAFASAEEIQPDCRTEGQLLMALGVFKESDLGADLLAKKVTRGEFAEKLAVLLKKQNDAGDTVYFYDSKNMPEVNALAAAGIFKGNPNGYFYPERNITKQEAAIALTRALGYETYVSVRGGSVSEYVLLAKKLGLISDFAMGEELSVAETAISLYNALFADVYEIHAVSDEKVTFTADGSNLLWILYNTVSIRGVVSASRFTGLYDESNLGENQIAVNDKIYKTTVESSWEYIGQNVTAFVKTDSNIETVNCIVPDDESNETITLYAGEFTYNNQVIEYEDENGRSRTITLPNSMAVIKNHQAVTADYDRAFNIKLGTVRLYKSEYISTNGYCVAVIDSAETALVELVDFEEDIVYTNNEAVRRIECKDNGQRYVSMTIKPSDSKIGAVQLKRGNIIEVYRSENGQYTKIYLCAESIEGTITSISKKSDRTLIDINGKNYETSRGFVGTPEFTVGLTADFYFDTQGKIVYYIVKNIAKGAVYAYIYAADKLEEAFEDKYAVKLYDENGQHRICELAQKVNFDGTMLPAVQAYEKLIDPGTGKAARQLVIFETNKSGHISYIDSAAPDKAAREADGTLWEVAGIGAYRYCNTQYMFYPSYPLRGTRTKVFVIPPRTVAAPVEKNFAVMTFEVDYPFLLEADYTVGFYKKTTADPYMDVVLYELNETPEYQRFKSVLIAEKVYETFDKENGEIYVNMDCYIGPYKANVNFAQEVIITKVDNTTITIPATDISKYIDQGDIMHYTENVAGEVARISLIYDYDADKTSWGDAYSNYASGSSNYPLEGLLLADVAKVYKNPSSNSLQALVTVSKNGVNEEYISILPTQFQAVVYDSSLRENNFYIGDLEDLVSLEQTGNTSCSRLFIQKTVLQYTTIVIYK